MNQDLDALGLIRDLTADELEYFKTCLTILISKTFIIRGIEKERNFYNFTVRNFALFEAWFSCMGASLVKDESLGVIAYRGSGKTRVFFSKEEICAVLTMRLIYEEKRFEVTLAAFPSVTISSFQQKYNALTGEDIRKTSLVNVLRKLSSYKLIALKPQDYSDPETLILLYPSIPLSIDRQALDDAIAFLGSKGQSPQEGAPQEGLEEIMEEGEILE